jgi:hypothetical protein
LGDIDMNTIRGTAAELAGRLTFNGVALSQPEISMLTRLGNGIFAHPVETVRTGEGRGGKPATVWEFDAEGSFDVKLARKRKPGNKVTEKVTANSAPATNDGEVITAEVRAEIDNAVTEIINRAKGATSKRSRKPKAKK